MNQLWEIRLTVQLAKWLRKWSSVLLALPFIHICVCFLYLAIYFYIFGHGLSTFADAGDIFSVSFSNIAPFYVSTILGLGGNRTIDVYSEEPGVDTRRGCLLVGVAIPATITVIYILAVIAAEYSRSGFVMLWLLWIALLLGALDLSDFFFTKRSKGWRDRLFVVFWVSTSLIITAWAHVQRDLYYDYDELLNDSSTCHGDPILTRLGDQYLIARRDNSRWLVDSKCELGARIAPPPQRTYPRSWRVNFWPF